MNRKALIIASYRYQDAGLQKLVAPAQDAKALARVLKDPAIGGFEVQSLLNEPLQKVNPAIEIFFAESKRDDLLLLYFSGHGIKDRNGLLYFATSDTRFKTLRTTAIPANLVNEMMRESRSRQQVLLLDCCYSGAFARGMVAKADKSIGTKECFEGRGRVILTASDAMQYSFEGNDIQGEGKQSIFTRFLVQGLETGEADLNSDGVVSLDELYAYTHDRVSDGMPQTPQKWAFDVEGDIIIAHNPKPPEPPAPETSLPQWMLMALESGDYSAQLAVIGELAKLSQGPGNSILAAEAQAKLEQLSQESENPAVRGAAAGALEAPAAGVQKPQQAKVLRFEAPIHLELVYIPAGPFLMGSDPKKDQHAQADEQPQHRAYVEEYHIGRHPVTNAQYATFVKATNHRAPEHWKNGDIPPGKKDHPVVYVSWSDAMAFCKWLSQMTGQSFRLPTEAEWEKAARGSDGRLYPWGDGQPTADLCNFKATGDDTTPVGQYSPQGDSPYGCTDMAGNVWEWTQSLWGSNRDTPDFAYPYNPDDGRENAEASPNELRVWRGGAFLSPWELVRCASRNKFTPNLRDRYLGFRVVLEPR